MQEQVESLDRRLSLPNLKANPESSQARDISRKDPVNESSLMSELFFLNEGKESPQEEELMPLRSAHSDETM